MTPNASLEYPKESLMQVKEISLEPLEGNNGRKLKDCRFSGVRSHWLSFSSHSPFVAVAVRIM